MAKIIGNVATTPMAIPDWNQTDANKADYIKNKPELVDLSINEESVVAIEGQTSFDVSFDSAENLQVYHNGLLLAENINYTFENGVVTLTGYAANEGDLFVFTDASMQGLGTQNIGVVQTTGDSTTDVMSQKAVTDEIINLLNGESKGFATGESIVITDVSPTVHNMNVRVSSKNLIPYPYEETTLTRNGITYTDNGDGSITVNGTATDDSFFVLSNKSLGLTSDISAINKDFGTNNKYAVSKWLYLNATDNITSIYINQNTICDNVVLYPQVEKGRISTAYTSYVDDFSGVKLLVGGDDSVNPIEYIANTDGTVQGVKSIYPTTILSTDTTGTVIDVEYNNDINKAFVKSMTPKNDDEMRVYANNGLKDILLRATGNKIDKGTIPQRGFFGEIMVGAPIKPQDAVNKQYAETHFASKEDVAKNMDIIMRKLTNLDSAAANTIYEDVIDEGLAQSVTVPQNVLPYGSLSMIGGASYIRAKNLIPFPYDMTTMINNYNGVFRTVNNDSSFTITGTSKADMIWWFIPSKMNWVVEWGKKYFFSGCPQGGSDSTFYFQIGVVNNSNSTIQRFFDYGDGVEVDLTSIDNAKNLTLSLVIKSGTEFNVDNIFRPQLELGEVATESELYTIKATPIKQVRIKSEADLYLTYYTSGTNCTFDIQGNKITVTPNAGYSGQVTAHLKVPNAKYGKTYTLFSKTTATSDGTYPYFGLGFAAPFDNTSIARYVFTMNSTNRIVMSFNSAMGTTETWIDIREGDVQQPANLFELEHDDIIIKIPNEATKQHNYGHGVQGFSNYNYIDFETKEYHQWVNIADKNDTDEFLIDDGERGIIDNTTVAIADLTDYIFDDDFILPLQSGDELIFEIDDGVKAPVPVPYRIKYQVKI